MNVLYLTLNGHYYVLHCEKLSMYFLSLTNIQYEK